MKYVLILPLLALALTVRPQSSSDSSASCVTWWRQGDRRTYSILHEKQGLQPDQPNVVARFAYEAAIEVLDVSDTDYTVKWVFHIPAGTNGGPMDSLPAFEGLQVVYRITNTGGFAELLNWEEVRDHYAQIMHFPPDLFTTKEKVEAALIKEIQLFHAPYGYTFTTTRVSYNTHLSNPFGGSPLPAIQIFQLTKLDPVEFTLVIRQDIDKTSLDRSIETRLRSIKSPEERNAKKAQLTSLQLSDYSEYRITRYTGWVRHLFYKRTSVVGGISQSDAYTIDLKD